MRERNADSHDNLLGSCFEFRLAARRTWTARAWGAPPPMMAIPFLVNAIFNFAIGILVARFLGPDEYGHYALAMSIGILMQTLGLDWIRLSATRFYSEKDRSIRPEIRATLDVIFLVIAGTGVVAALIISVSGFEMALPSTLLALAISVAVANGLFEFSAALVRARFANRAYAILVTTKNLLAISLTVGGAWTFGSAKMALLGLILSIGGSLIVSSRVLRDRAATFGVADRALAIRFAAYAIPIVMANVLYQGATTTNRAILSQVHDFAQAGQLALAFDMGIRIVGAIGASFDVLLFQVAVRAEKTGGAAAARQQVSRNVGILFAVILPSVAGCWLVLPSFEHLLIPEAFRGTFSHYFTLILPAMLCFALTQYCVGPAFQIAHRTMPLIVGGLVSASANGLAILFLPSSADASSFAIAQSIGACASLATMIAFLITLEPMWPRGRDVGGALVGTAAMILAVGPLRGMCPCATTLSITALLGVGVYTLAMLAFDVGDVRSALDERYRIHSAARQAGARPAATPGPAASVSLKGRPIASAATRAGPQR